jgi:hypothetical protein
LRALKKHPLELKQFEHVHHVDVGFRYRDGKRTEALAIRVFIHGPKRGNAKSRRLAPRTWRGYPIDVISSTFKRHCATAPEPGRIAPTTPLLGGLSIGSNGHGAGTLGMLVRSTKCPGLLMLTCNHVADLHAQVFQPAQTDSAASRLVGETFDVSYSDLASVVRIYDVTGLERHVLGLPAVSGVVGEAELREICLDHAEVVKSGRSTAITIGQLDGLSPTGTVSIVNPADSPQPEVGCEGDSGAIWMTKDQRAVGMHYAGEPWRASAQAMYLIKQNLGLIL